jgi:hypothetical protein
MCDWVVDKKILWEYSLVRTCHFLWVFCKSFKSKLLLICILKLSCYDVHCLVVIFVNWFRFLYTILNWVELGHCCRLVHYWCLSELNWSFCQFNFTLDWLCSLKTKKWVKYNLTRRVAKYNCSCCCCYNLLEMNLEPLKEQAVQFDLFLEQHRSQQSCVVV